MKENLIIKNENDSNLAATNNNMVAHHPDYLPQPSNNLAYGIGKGIRMWYDKLSNRWKNNKKIQIIELDLNNISDSFENTDPHAQSITKPSSTKNNLDVNNNSLISAATNQDIKLLKKLLKNVGYG